MVILPVHVLVLQHLQRLQQRHNVGNECLVLVVEEGQFADVSAVYLHCDLVLEVCRQLIEYVVFLYHRERIALRVVLHSFLYLLLEHMRYVRLRTELLDDLYLVAEVRLACVHSSEHGSECADRERVESDADQHPEDGQHPFEQTERVDVPVADREHSGHGPVQGEQVLLADGGVDQTVADDPGVGLEVVEFGGQVPHAGGDVQTHEHGADEREQTHDACVYLQELLHSEQEGVLGHGRREQGEQTRHLGHFEQTVQTGQTQQPQQLDVVGPDGATSSRNCSGGQGVFDEVDGDARHQVDQEPAFQVVAQDLPARSDQHSLVLVVVGGDAVHEHVHHEQEVGHDVQVVPEVLVVFLQESQGKGHYEADVDEEEHDQEGPQLLETGVRVDVEVRLTHMLFLSLVSVLFLDDLLLLRATGIHSNSEIGPELIVMRPVQLYFILDSLPRVYSFQYRFRLLPKLLRSLFLPLFLLQ